MKSRSKPRRTLLRLGMLLGAAAMLGGDLPSPSPAPDGSPAHLGPPAAGGLRAVIDPATGEKVADAAPPFTLLAKDAEALSQSTAGLTVIQRPDGSKHLYLGGRFMCGTAVRVGPDGVHQYCVSSPAQDRKSTRLNSSHLGISYAVFCLQKKR